MQWQGAQLLAMALVSFRGWAVRVKTSGSIAGLWFLKGLFSMMS